MSSEPSAHAEELLRELNTACRSTWVERVQELLSLPTCRKQGGTYQPVRSLSQALQELCLDVRHILPAPHHVDGIHQGCMKRKAHSMHCSLGCMYKNRWQRLSKQM